MSLFLLTQLLPQQAKSPQSPQPPPVLLLLVVPALPLLEALAPPPAPVVAPVVVLALVPPVPLVAVVAAPPAPPVVTTPPHPSGKSAVIESESASINRSIRSMVEPPAW
jgi:hypothetical protein